MIDGYGECVWSFMKPIAGFKLGPLCEESTECAKLRNVSPTSLNSEAYHRETITLSFKFAHSARLFLRFALFDTLY